MGERCGVVLVAELLIPAHELLGRLPTGEPVDVHDEEADVGEHVDDAPAIVEREAVDDPWTVVEAEDVVGGEITVDVANEPAGQTGLEQCLAAGQVALGQSSRPARSLPRR